jgi:hypothetical protein
MSVMQWVGKNLSLGGLVTNGSWLTGLAVEGTCKGIGAAAELIGGDASDTAKQIKSFCYEAGETLGAGLTKGGEFVGDLTNKGVELVGKGTGAVAGMAAEALGCEKETVKTVTMVANVAGRAAVGLAAGVVVADLAVAASAISGTAGAAATTSGLAAVGGGSMAAGQVVTQTVAAAGALSGAVSQSEPEQTDPVNAQK